MKDLFKVFELSKNEQRVVLIVMFLLLAFAIIGYERRVNHSPTQQTPTMKPKPSPTALETENDR